MRELSTYSTLDTGDTFRCEEGDVCDVCTLGHGLSEDEAGAPVVSQVQDRPMDFQGIHVVDLCEGCAEAAGIDVDRYIEETA